jgi:DNA-binding transcriptional regulator YiaG
MNGAELKAARKLLGLSISEISEEMAVEPRTWCRWESEASRIPEHAIKLFYLVYKEPLSAAAKQDKGIKVLGTSLLIGDALVARS